MLDTLEGLLSQSPFLRDIDNKSKEISFAALSRSRDKKVFNGIHFNNTADNNTTEG